MSQRPSKDCRSMIDVGVTRWQWQLCNHPKMGTKEPEEKNGPTLWLIIDLAVGIPTVTCVLLADLFFVPYDSLWHWPKQQNKNRTCRNTTLSNTLGVPATTGSNLLNTLTLLRSSRLGHLRQCSLRFFLVHKPKLWQTPKDENKSLDLQASQIQNKFNNVIES